MNESTFLGMKYGHIETIKRTLHFLRKKHPFSRACIWLVQNESISLKKNVLPIIGETRPLLSSFFQEIIERHIFEYSEKIKLEGTEVKKGSLIFPIYHNFNLLGVIVLCKETEWLINRSLDLELEYVSFFIGELIEKYVDHQDQESATYEDSFEDILCYTTHQILELNPKAEIIYSNPAFLDTLGFTREEISGRKFIDLIEETEQERIGLLFEQQLKDENSLCNYQIPIKTAEEEIRWLDFNISIVKESYNTPRRILVASRDITLELRNLFQLRLQEEKYQRIITNMDLGLLEVGHDDTILRASKTFSNLSGYSEKELIGRKASDIFLSDEEDKIFIEKKNQIREVGISDKYPIKIRRKDGEFRWWLISGAPNFDIWGNQIGSIGIHLDITEQKTLEEKLQDAKTKAEEFAKAKATFLANMSHEIRTPLNAISGMLRELGRELIVPKYANLIQNAKTATRHLHDIISNILDMTKVESGELKLESYPFNLGNLIEDTCSMLSIKAKEKDLTLTSDISTHIHNAYLGDPTRIRQILINIVGNAIKFTHTGYVKINCNATEIGKQHLICLEIKDTGIGMSAEYQQNLFRQFSQEDISTARKYGGTGLGMAITHELVKLMGGNITVESQRGLGTSICIHFPLNKSKVQIQPQDSQANDYAKLGGKRVLLVEDNRMNRLIASNSLIYFGMQVFEAQNGLEAIEILKKHSFDFVLMDLQMPLMGGLEAVKHIRNDLKIEIPIIALSANAFKSEIERCLSEGMNAYITKPFEESDLMQTIHDCLFADKAICTNSQHKQRETRDQKLYSLQGLKKIGQGNAAFLQKMVHIFQEEAMEGIKELRRSATSQELESLYRIAHKIKPMIDNMGIDILKEEIRIIETSAKEKTYTKELQGIVDHICIILEKVIEQLKFEFPKKD